MKPRALVALVFLGVTTSAVGQERPGIGHAAPSPPSRSGKTGGVVVLRTPIEGEVSFPETLFQMGSAPTEVAEGVALCERETAPAFCELPLAREETRLEELLGNELVMHEVSLDAFAIDRTEVTVAAYRRCVDIGTCAHMPWAEGNPHFDRPELPIAMVTWDEARTFCRAQHQRLPTEAEWERAARGSFGRRFPWGSSYHPDLANHGAFTRSAAPLRRALPDAFALASDVDASDGFAELAPVGSFPDGATPEGIFDMAGNVGEWTEDGYEERFDPASVHNPLGSAASPFKVIRGGGFLQGAPFLRSASRVMGNPSAREPWVGFRCARTL